MVDIEFPKAGKSWGKVKWAIVILGNIKKSRRMKAKVGKLIRKIKFRIQIIFGLWHNMGQANNTKIGNVNIISADKVYFRRDKNEKV